MSRTFLFSAMLALFVTSPAAAGCLAVLSELHERIIASRGQEREVELRTQSGRVTVEQQADGAPPTESWGGASSGLGGARRPVRDARLMHQDANEDGCLILVEEARAWSPTSLPEVADSHAQPGDRSALASERHLW